jgi:hypothetical protein
MRDRVCEECGRNSGRNRFCAKCKPRVKGSRPTTAVCECGKTFEVTVSNKRYCSPLCQQRARHRRNNRNRRKSAADTKKSYRVFYPDCAQPDEYTRTDFDAHKKTLRLMGARWERI